jgi:hypothetical protein
MANFRRCFPPFRGRPAQDFEAFLLLVCIPRVLHFATSFCPRELAPVASPRLSLIFARMEFLLAWELNWPLVLLFIDYAARIA